MDKLNTLIIELAKVCFLNNYTMKQNSYKYYEKIESNIFLVTNKEV